MEDRNKSGRGKTAQILSLDRSLNRIHGYVIVSNQNVFYIDSSKRGTVDIRDNNQDELIKNDCTILKQNDVMRIGSITFMLVKTENLKWLKPTTSLHLIDDGEEREEITNSGNSTPGYTLPFSPYCPPSPQYEPMFPYSPDSTMLRSPSPSYDPPTPTYQQTRSDTELDDTSSSR